MGPDSLLWGMILRELWRPQTTSPVLYFSIKNSPLCWVFPGLFTQIYGTIWNPTYHVSSILRHWEFWPCKIQWYVEIADYDSWGCLSWVFPCRHRGLPPLCPSHCRCSALYATWAEVRLSSVTAGYHPCSILGWNWGRLFGSIWLIGKVVVVVTVVVSFDMGKGCNKSRSHF